MDKKSHGTEVSDLNISKVSAITPHNKALWEIGKMLWVESIQTGREFCQYMISTCFGAIPVYLALLKVFVADTRQIGLQEGLLILIPVCFFLASSVVFMLGYMPIKSTVSLDIPAEIEQAHISIVERRTRLIRIGAALFLIGIIFAVVIVVIII